MSNYKWKLSMPLAPKTQIDRYEIRSLLGAGGMDPTRLQHSTPGVILGTAGYMSPEQVQGKTKEIDHRADIFSFGCILFEAVTRRRASHRSDPRFVALVQKIGLPQ